MEIFWFLLLVNNKFSFREKGFFLHQCATISPHKHLTYHHYVIILTFGTALKGLLRGQTVSMQQC